MRDEYLEIAQRIGARLCRDALWSAGRCNWTADRLDGSNLVHGSLGPDLYGGTSGIALFLWTLAERTGDRIFRLTAQAALRQALSKPPMGCGFFDGGLGIRFAAAEIQGEIDTDAVIRQATPEPSMLDVIGGSAGAIAALLSFGRRFADARFVEAAVRHGDQLLAKASREDDGWSWQTIPATRHPVGFSHGAAGIGWALAELYRATGESRFCRAALEAFRYERSCFHAGEQNWPDFRDPEPSYPALWCHGAAGIGFSRLRAGQILGGQDLLAEARTALATVCAGSGSTGNFSLCHGEAGNADLLIYASQVLGETNWLDGAAETAERGAGRYEWSRAGWPCGLNRGNETPDLMLGLAGIGYFYLRMADPRRTPTVLLPCIGHLE